jgi:uncharacterized membrane protein
MRNCKSIAYMLGFVLAFMVAATAADAPPPLTFKFKKFTVPGSVDTNPGGISNTGVIVGQYTDKNLVLHGFILKGTKLTKLDDPKGTAGTTGASNLALDGAIRVVGAYTNAKTGAVTGFLYKGGKFTDIPGPKGAIASSASAINDAGDIVGDYVDSSSVTHGFLLKGGKYKTLDPPGSLGTVATGVDKKDNVVMYWVNSGGTYESSLYNGKTYKTINVPNETSSIATDINTAGDVTYQVIDSAGANHGALRHAGKYYVINYPKSAFTFSGAVNDHSTIVGAWRTTSSGSNIGYTATFK